MNPQTRVTKRVPFSAAHHIPGAGKCENNHGHNWIANISVDLIGGELDKRGFVVDVAALKQCAFKYDHDDLNEYFEYPSTENVAQKIANDALEVCKVGNPDGVYVVNCHLIETENNTANAQATNFAWVPPVQGGNVELQTKSALDSESAYTFGGGTIPPPQKAVKFVKRQK